MSSRLVLTQSLIGVFAQARMDELEVPVTAPVEEVRHIALDMDYGVIRLPKPIRVKDWEDRSYLKPRRPERR